jgi:uncharacterized protein (DUF305 family)
MNEPSMLRPLAALLVGLAAAACGGTARPGPGESGAPETPTRPTTYEAPADAELEALFWARADSARMRYTDADIRFVNGMIAHHAQAVLMARLVPSRTASSSIEVLAARIANAQEDEIALMQQWLNERGQPVPEVHIDGTTLMVHGTGDHDMHAAGMLTPAQLAWLGEARGREFDRLFLLNMIEHHRGAVGMVEALFASDGAGQDPAVFRMASDIQVDQLTEIARMERMLAQYPPGGAGR